MMKAQYAYASDPKPANDSIHNGQPPSLKKYENKDASGRPVNIMYDKRIYRGNTYAAPIAPLSTQPDPVELQRQHLLKRKLKAAKRAELQKRLPSPDPVDGRVNMEIQTDHYLEEFADTVPEAYASTQTDAFLDRAPSPLYIPTKSGVDIATQIMEGDLFDFDMEVEPMLEVLIGRTLDQAMLEVTEEHELAMLRQRQRDFEVRKQLQVMEVQRLEQAEKRHLEEKERRKKEADRILKEKEIAAMKVAAASFASAYFSKLIPSSLDSLEEDGFFYNAREREIQQLYLPTLTEHVQARIAHYSLSRRILDGIYIYIYIFLISFFYFFCANSSFIYYLICLKREKKKLKSILFLFK